MKIGGFGGANLIRFELFPMWVLFNIFSDMRKSGKFLFVWGKSLISPPGFQDTMGRQRIRKGLAEPVVWLGLEDFRSLVGTDQFFW
jgi:hypothetical protein